MKQRVHPDGTSQIVIPDTEFHDFIDAMVATIETKDSFTRGHSQRVSELSLELALHMGLDDQLVSDSHFGGHLHDIGKVGIPLAVLNKPGPLSRLELEQVQRHPEMGFEILKPVHSLKRLSEVILFHHERYDGWGYPQGLKGEAIPFAARVVAVADALDAMLSARSYRRRMTFDEARQEVVTHAGDQFDPAVAKALESCPCEFRRLYEGESAPAQRPGPPAEEENIIHSVKLR